MKQQNSKLAINIPTGIREDWVDETGACTVVQALLGFGKTAVYRVLAEETEHSVWLTADLSDSDPEHFLRKMENAWNQIDEAAMDKLSGSEQEGLWDRVDDLIERTYHWSDRWNIVWDDAQMLGEKSWELLIFFIKRTGSYIHFILLTDSEPPVELRHLLRQSEARHFTENDLKSVSDDVIAGSFLGWPYGVSLASTYVESCKSADIDLHILLRETGLAKVIEDVMWEPLTDEERELFVQAAVLDEFSWELCDAVTGHSASRHTFEMMISKTYMVERTRCQDGMSLSGDGMPEQPIVDEWYRFGDAYATFLRERIPENKKREIYARAALWCRGVGDHAGMVRYAIDGHRTEILTEVIEKEGSRLLAGRHALGRIIRYLEEEGVTFSTAAAGIAGQYYYAEGNLGRMEEYLNAADSAYGKENRYSAYRSLYRALDRYDSDPDRYDKQLRNAMFFLRENELPLPWLNPETEERLERLLRAGETGERTLRVETLGSFRVIATRDEHEITWRTRKARELFAYLTDLRGETVDRRQLMDVMWPEEIPTNAVAMLHNMIYNIRKELSEYCLEEMIVYENRRYRLCPQELNNTAESLISVADAVERQDMEVLLVRKELFLKYPGRYLEDIDAAWADERREYYDGIYRRGCAMLADRMRADGKTDEAIRLYKNISKTDPYAEEVVEQLLLLYGEKRELDSVKKCYESFSERLREELGVEPGEAVRRAYERGMNA